MSWLANSPSRLEVVFPLPTSLQHHVRLHTLSRRTTGMLFAQFRPCLFECDLRQPAMMALLRLRSSWFFSFVVALTFKFLRRRPALVLLLSYYLWTLGRLRSGRLRTHERSSSSSMLARAFVGFMAAVCIDMDWERHRRMLSAKFARPLEVSL